MLLIYFNIYMYFFTILPLVFFLKKKTRAIVLWLHKQQSRTPLSKTQQLDLNDNLGKIIGCSEIATIPVVVWCM